MFEWAMFNMGKEKTHETVEAIITDLHRMADTFNYGSFKEEKEDLLGKKASEKLQPYVRLKLQEAIEAARNSETVRHQQHGTVGSRGSAGRRRRNS